MSARVSVSPVAPSIQRAIPRSHQHYHAIEKPLTHTHLIAAGFLVFAALVILLQLGRFACCASMQLVGLVKQWHAVEQAHQAALAKQDVLEDKIALYQTPYGVEEMARERLGMVGKDEILVRVYPVSVAKTITKP